jgi:hypothetical protein
MWSSNNGNPAWSLVAPLVAEWCYGGSWMILRPSLTTFGGEMIDPTEICRAMFAGGVVAILLQIFAEVIYGSE